MPVIDGVAAATALVEGIVRWGLTTSGLGMFRALEATAYGDMADPAAARGPALKLG